MKKTIKYKVLKLMKGEGTIRRKDLCLLIFKAQGMRVTKNTKYAPGYYGNNLRNWIDEGLLEQPNGKGYKLTKSGLRYLVNPELEHYKIQAKLAKARLKRVLDNRLDQRQEVSQLRSKLRDIQRIANQ